MLWACVAHRDEVEALLRPPAISASEPEAQPSLF
jgi:hypothetical protein